jgi:hypothetical protein
VLVVDEVAGAVELPGECVHGDSELCEAGCRGRRVAVMAKIDDREALV